MQKQVKNKKQNFFVKHKDQIINYAVLAIGCLTCCFTRFTFNMWFCAFIFPACFLFFERREKAYISLPLIFASSVIGGGVAIYRMTAPAGIGIQIAVAFLAGAVTAIPYILDKLIYTRFFNKNQLVLSFLFPLTWVILDIILGLTPLGNVFSLCYALCQLLNVVSVIGLLGTNFLTFVIVYFCTATVQFILNWKANVKAFVVGTSLVGFSLAYAGIANITSNPYETSIKVMTGYSTNLHSSYERNKLTKDENLEWIITDALLAKANNIEMLVYPEEAFWLYDSEVDDFKTAIKYIASNNNLYIVSGIEITNNNTEDNWRNQGWIVTPNDEIIVYTKCHFVPIEEDGLVRGDGLIKYVDIPNKGRVGIVVCMDLEFPTFISKVGRLNCDTLIAPSWDWDDMFPNHTYTTCYRAIENGVNFLRCTEEGLTAACDYKGNVVTSYYTKAEAPDKLAHSNHIFTMPMKGRRTAYSYLGLATNYLYPTALATLIIVFSILNNKDKKKINKKK